MFLAAGHAHRAAVGSSLASESDETSKRERTFDPLAWVLAVGRRIDNAPVAQRKHTQTLESKRFVA